MDSEASQSLCVAIYLHKDVENSTQFDTTFMNSLDRSNGVYPDFRITKILILGSYSRHKREDRYLAIFLIVDYSWNDIRWV